MRLLRSISCRISGVRMSCIARSSFDPWITIELARDMKLFGIIDSRYGKSKPRGFLKRITTIDSSSVGIQRAMNGFDVSTVGTRWKFDIGFSELWTDEAHVVGHPAEDCVGHCFARVPARCTVTVNFLDPFKVDHRHNADLEVDMRTNIDFVGDDSAVQPLVEQNIGIFGQGLPVRESAGWSAK